MSKKQRRVLANQARMLHTSTVAATMRRHDVFPWPAVTIIIGSGSESECQLQQEQDDLISVCRRAEHRSWSACEHCTKQESDKQTQPHSRQKIKGRALELGETKKITREREMTSISTMHESNVKFAGGQPRDKHTAMTTWSTKTLYSVCTCAAKCAGKTSSLHGYPGQATMQNIAARR